MRVLLQTTTATKLARMAGLFWGWFVWRGDAGDQNLPLRWCCASRVALSSCARWSRVEAMMGRPFLGRVVVMATLERRERKQNTRKSSCGCPELLVDSTLLKAELGNRGKHSSRLSRWGLVRSGAAPAVSEGKKSGELPIQAEPGSCFGLVPALEEP